MFNASVSNSKMSACHRNIRTSCFAALLLTASGLGHSADHSDATTMAQSPIATATTTAINHCANTSQTETRARTSGSVRQTTIGCMIDELQTYQQATMSARQQYFAYKAQAWLNYANHQTSIKSLTAAGEHAYDSGVVILEALKRGEENDLSLITDIPSTSALMRPDLWATLTALKADNGIVSAPRELAFSEVALIWAAANQCERGWRQSSAHFRMADRWLEQAREAYVNDHNSAENVALIEQINRYYKQYAPLDPTDDVCQGQAMPMSSQMLNTIQTTSQSVAFQSTAIPMPIPTATYSIVY